MNPAVGAEAPFLKRIVMLPERVKAGEFPFNLPILRNGLDLPIDSYVTFLAGQNGSGKSTLLEAVADKCGFNLAGGSRNHNYNRHPTESQLAPAIRLWWRKKITRGFFLRAESFFNFSTHIDDLDRENPADNALAPYGGKSLHEQSHGESFLEIAGNYFTYFREAIYLLDEPEAAMSPARQLLFLKLIHELASARRAQFLIATHSPILLALPGADLLWLDDSGIRRISYEETEHFTLMRDFMRDPRKYVEAVLSADKA